MGYCWQFASGPPLCKRERHKVAPQGTRGSAVEYKRVKDIVKESLEAGSVHRFQCCCGRDEASLECHTRELLYDFERLGASFLVVVGLERAPSNLSQRWMDVRNAVEPPRPQNSTAHVEGKNRLVLGHRLDLALSFGLWWCHVIKPVRLVWDAMGRFRTFVFGSSFVRCGTGRSVASATRGTCMHATASATQLSPVNRVSRAASPSVSRNESNTSSKTASIAVASIAHNAALDAMTWRAHAT
ncbi:Aste57867_9628 [Aphanomyces stellatus]|uniref:Aste57867_9628 protein n=1 Tax=Aphanomyces stellatus TaxID=120398 RepID=A0A485KNG4_9STRA|nr:hypothetical protein As57867_009590 [Aphanomyces stellatus]VFT86507.1 Aste57867_9628 [Aphanomyces stellatus]